ncbi:MAG: cellulase family glycosylhydrolase, partial [Thermoproteota archaeon]
EAEQKQITDELDIAAQWAREHNNVSLFMGEFGAYSKADMESRVRWTYFVAREAEKRNISWAYWEFCSGFGAYDPVKNKWREDLLNALIPPSNKYYVSVDTEHGKVLGSGWYNEGSYAVIKVNETSLGFLVQDVFDHFEGLSSRDIAVDARTVKVYVDGPRTIRAIWRKDYVRIMLVIVGVCIIASVAAFLYKMKKLV